MNTMVPEPTIPSHQGPDAQTVLPGLDLVTIAAKGAHTQTHNHYWTIQLTRQATREEVLAALRAAPRIAFIRMSDGLVALNSTIELKIGKASCRERVCQYVSISVVAVSLKKKNTTPQ